MDCKNKTLQELIDIVEEKGFNIKIPIISIGQDWFLESIYGKVKIYGNRRSLELDKLYELINRIPNIESYLKLHLEEAILVQI
ncbi:MAG: hypothetical protein H8D97_00480 [Proteobacteria bacterium]|nr:hypothetical protein [Pseudomonadota bacterium]